MQKALTYTFCLLLGLTLFSCNKEIPEIPESNDPVFKLSGTIGTDSISYNVGDDGAFITTSTEIIHEVPYFSGTLKCGENEIELGVFNGNNETGTVDVADFINAPQFSFARQASEPLFLIDKNFFSNSMLIKEIKWKVNGVYAGTNDLCLYQPGKYDLTAMVTYSNNTTAEVTNEILLGYQKSNAFSLDYSVNNGQVNCWINSVLGNVSSVKWYVNDELMANASMLYYDFINQSYHIRAEVTFSDGSVKTRNIYLNGANYYYSLQDFAELENQSSFYQDYCINLTIIHNGQEYNSMNVDNSNFKLTVSSFELYDIDTNGKPTYKVTGYIEGKVKSKSTNDIKDVKLNVQWAWSIK